MDKNNVENMNLEFSKFFRIFYYTITVLETAILMYVLMSQILPNNFDKLCNVVFRTEYRPACKKYCLYNV